MRRSISGTARRTIAAAAGVLFAGSLVAGPAQAAETRETNAAGYPYLTTVKWQWTHETPDWYTESHKGSLNAGSNYFKCWKWGAMFQDNGRTSSRWLRTDDDEGYVDVYVSAVNLDAGSFDHYLYILGQC